MKKITQEIIKSHLFRNIKIFLKKAVFFICLLILLVLQTSVSSNPSKITHKIALVHPAIDKDNAVDCYLIEEDLPNGTKQFYLDVDSVNCGENICKVVTVRMFWDELGRYVTYELGEGEGLEKKEGAPFTKEDYEKLEWVLNNKNSELENVFKDDLVVSDFVEHGSVDVDAVSGATSTVSASETVEGAIWTCFTLWHWANGEIVDKIRNLTRKKLSHQNLIEGYLEHQDSGYKKFAIESFGIRNKYDATTINQVEKQAVKSTYDVFKEGLTYFENLPQEAYYGSISRVFTQVDHKKRVACLNSVSETDKGKNTAYYHQLSKSIVDFSYQEVEMFLTNLKFNNFTSPTLIENLIELLKSDDFLIARRSYWFLSHQKELLNRKQKKKVRKFRKKHKNIL